MGLNGLLNQSIIVKNPTGSTDRHGKESLGAAVTLKARFERKYKVIYNANKEATPTQAVFMVGPDTAVEIGAQIKYGDDYYRVLVRNDAPGRNGSVHHYELICQLWSYSS